jgi:hypothetical protein
MSCDYYIYKNLYIYDYDDNILSYINLQKEKGYYYFFSTLDEDEDGYDTEYLQYKIRKLKPSMKPIEIYNNNTFNKLLFENKYKKMVENELASSNKSWNDVNKIIKIENRYEV